MCVFLKEFFIILIFLNLIGFYDFGEGVNNFFFFNIKFNLGKVKMFMSYIFFLFKIKLVFYSFLREKICFYKL